MRQNAAAHARERRVAADKVIGRAVDEVEQLFQRVGVDDHRRMLGVHRNAVLVEVRVRRELPEPLFPVQFERNIAERGAVGAAAA